MPAYVFDYSLDRELWHILDDFTQGYIECAMWTLTDDDGHSLDHLGLHDIAPETIAKVSEDCRAFQDTYAKQLSEAGDAAQNGHDFWLTRNRHGAGFWDRGYQTWIDKELTEGSHAYGEVWWYVGDDGLIYQG
jgi:hypothetical protein